MQRILPVLLLSQLLALTGCNSSSTHAIPPTTGDFVTNNDGVGTAQVFGIEFRVNANSSGATTEDSIDLNLVDGDQSTARKYFALGDDIRIQLDSVNESEVGFIFNGQGFGNLNVGDRVVIDDERNVEVNGTTRLPKSKN